MSSVKAILEDTVSLLTYDASWLEELTLHHKFAFGVISVCCSLIPVAENCLDWTLPYCKVIQKLGTIFTCYCKAKGMYMYNELRILLCLHNVIVAQMLLYTCICYTN